MKNIFNLILRLFSKCKREIYRFFHPCLWGKRLQINGIPSITGIHCLKIGKDVSINDKVYIQCSGGVSIEDRVTLSHGVTILTQGLDSRQYILNCKKQFREHISDSVFIGEGTWIAANVTICPGSRIPKDCIIAAGSVVTGELSDQGCLYGGVPAKKIKTLNC